MEKEREIERGREGLEGRGEFVPICLKALCTCQWVGCHTYVRPERAVNTFLRVHHDLFHPIASITQTLRRAGYRCTTTATITAATRAPPSRHRRRHRPASQPPTQPNLPPPAVSTHPRPYLLLFDPALQSAVRPCSNLRQFVRASLTDILIMNIVFYDCECRPRSRCFTRHGKSDLPRAGYIKKISLNRRACPVRAWPLITFVFFPPRARFRGTMSMLHLAYLPPY